MAYASNTRGKRGVDRSGVKLDFAAEEGDWRETEAEPRDFKKFVLVLGLGALSWVATYIGMLELIQANLGELPFLHKVVIGFSVAMLMVMIIWLLDQLFKPHGPTVKLAYVGGYLFLTLISVGFGFGFYWKVLESRTEASRSATSATSQVQNALHGASTRLEQLQATLTQLAAVSQEKAVLEQEKGTSCPNSRPGDGPRRKMRTEDAAKFQFASEFMAGRIGAVKGQLSGLEGDIAKIAKGDKSIIDPKTGTRNRFMRELSRKLDRTVTGFNAFRTDPQLKQLRTDLSARAEKSNFDAGNGRTFSCPDAQLQQALRGAVRALDELPVLEKPEIAVVEGSEATIEAFRRLLATLEGALTFKLPPSADELRELQQKAIRSALSKDDQKKLEANAAGLSSRDYVPLAIAIFVDLCLLLVSMGRYTNRLESLVPKMRAAERGPVIEILSRFKDIHRDPDVRDNFEIFRHVVFDQNGDYYVAVPLDAPFRPNPRHPHQSGYGTAEAQELQHEAHLLANLFTSFEKERIFRRVYNPLLLNTAQIQKKLARQGSKFASCEAFRVYKFRDGAWSEIILGAVMGAARRAEAKRRRQDIEEHLFHAKGPELSPSVAAEKAMALDDLLAPAKQQLQDTLFDSGTPLPFAVDRETAPQRPQEPAAKDRAGERAAEKRSPMNAAAMDWTVEKLDRARRPVPEPEVLAKTAAKFGPYAGHVANIDDRLTGRPSKAAPQAAPLQDDAEVSFQAANANTAPAAAAARQPVSESASQTLAPALETSPASQLANLAKRSATVTGPVRVSEETLRGDHIDVVLTRDTATISVPVSEATLPNSVARLMSAAVNRHRPGAADIEEVQHTTPAVTEYDAAEAATIGPQEKAGEVEDVILLGPPQEDERSEDTDSASDPQDSELESEEIITIASRFAAGAGE